MTIKEKEIVKIKALTVSKKIAEQIQIIYCGMLEPLNKVAEQATQNLYDGKLKPIAWIQHSQISKALYGFNAIVWLILWRGQYYFIEKPDRVLPNYNPPQLFIV